MGKSTDMRSQSMPQALNLAQSRLLAQSQSQSQSQSQYQPYRQSSTWHARNRNRRPHSSPSANQGMVGRLRDTVSTFNAPPGMKHPYLHSQLSMRAPATTQPHS